MPQLKPGTNTPDKDVPMHGVEKKGDRACQHDYCSASRCRLDVAADAIARLKARADKLALS